MSAASAPLSSGPRTISAPIIKAVPDPRDAKLTASISEWRNRVRFGKTFTEYKVAVTLAPLAWTVFKRYSEFADLHKQLQEETKFKLPKLPAGKLIGVLVARVFAERLRCWLHAQAS